MTIDIAKVGKYIYELRKQKNITQNQLGERLNISHQAVSKWERGETLPDTFILIDLAKILETNVDNILNGGEVKVDFSSLKRVFAKDIQKGINSLSELGSLIGKNNTVYQGIIEGVSKKMNLDFEECLTNPYHKEAIISEILIQSMMNGAYVDVSDVKSNLEYDHWINIVCKYIEKHGLYKSLVNCNLFLKK